MRILILNKDKNKKNKSEHLPLIGRIRIVVFFLLLLISFIYSPLIRAQWTNDPAQNTKLVQDTDDPVNISCVNNKGGGVFLFWEDGKKGSNSNVFYQYIDKTGKPAFKGEGKKISSLKGKKAQPLSAMYSGNSAVVIWKDYTYEPQGRLIVQRVFSDGNLGWSESGLQITAKQNVLDYSIATDTSGGVFVAHIEKTNDPQGNYKITVQKINATGYIMYKTDGIVVRRSAVRCSSVSVVADENGGTYLLWLENINNRFQVLGQHVDASGRINWSKAPVVISSSNNSVFTFTALSTNLNSVYVAWQVRNKSKDILHQLVSLKGKLLWGSGGKLACQIKGNQFNPSLAVNDSSLYMSWTNEFNHDKDLYIQKYRLDGKPMWTESGIPVIAYRGDQFGQKLIADPKSGVFISWIDKRIDSLKANIYGQRINKYGKFLWDSLGLPLAKYKNSEKSYLNILSDYDNSSILIFKDKRGTNNGIYGQKIITVSSLIPQIVGLKTKVERDSVTISWYNTNEGSASSFAVQKLIEDSNGNEKWITIANIPINNTLVNAYEVTEKPVTSGVQNYRILVTDKDGNTFLSEISQINYFTDSDHIILGQNTPNPFTDFTEISFYLPSSMRVSFEFYNSRLETVREISNQYFEAGENKIAFNSDNLPAGIYFYRLKAGEYVDVKKMVLVK